LKEAEIAARLSEVRARIAQAAARAGRQPGDVAIVGVAKLHPVDAIAAAVRAGLTDVGENYAQEMAAKMDALPDLPVAWHFIGRLQRNKVKLVVGRAALVHAVDSIELAREIARRAAERGLVQPILIAVSAAGEAQKTGVDPAGVRALLDEIAGLPALEVRGLMTMPPWPESAEDSRPYFRDLRRIRDDLAGPSRQLPHLSMGTTGDLEVAVEEGATLVRVGTALFGPRPGPPA
jgi:pyridoxal phosphate enzyme (YggS family)